MTTEDEPADANDPSEAQKARAQRLRQRIADLAAGKPAPVPKEEDNPRAFVEKRMREGQSPTSEPAKDDQN
jgi:hypothetical protein